MAYPLSAPGLARGLAHPPPARFPESLLFYGAILLPLLVAAGFPRSRAPSLLSRKRSAAGFLALGACVSLFPRADWAHLRPVLFLVFPLAGGLIAGIPRERAPGRKKTLLALGLGAGLLGLFLAFFSFPPKGQPLEGARAGGIHADTKTAEELSGILHAIRENTRESDPLFVFPWAPLIYFLSERDNPTRVRIVWPGQWNSPEAQEEILSQLDGSGLEHAVWVRGMEALSGTPPQEFAPEIARFLERFFRPVACSGRFVFLEKRVEAVPARKGPAEDLFPPCPENKPLL